MKRLFLCVRMFLLIVVAGGLGACGGSSSASSVNLGGSITGLTVDNLVLTDSVSSVTLAANASSFTFPVRIAAGAAYSVSVLTQPPGLTCRVTNASGVAGSDDVTNVQVACVPNNSLGGMIAGLHADGLVLANGSDTVGPIAAGSTTFVFPNKVGVGFAYGVTVLSQPTGLTCSVQNGVGTMGAADVTSVQVTCM